MSIYVQVKLEDLIKLVSEKTESKQSIQEQENSVESGYKEIEKRFNPWLVDSQTPEICLIAVKKNGFALEYVREQTPEICLMAVKQNPDVYYLILDKTTRERVLRSVLCEQLL